MRMFPSLSQYVYVAQLQPLCSALTSGFVRMPPNLSDRPSMAISVISQLPYVVVPLASTRISSTLSSVPIWPTVWTGEQTFPYSLEATNYHLPFFAVYIVSLYEDLVWNRTASTKRRGRENLYTDLIYFGSSIQGLYVNSLFSKFSRYSLFVPLQ